MDLLRRSREAFLDRNTDIRQWAARGFSGTTYALWKAVRRLNRDYARGLALDAGAGRGGWRGLTLESATAYESIDVAPRGGHSPTWIGDICSMPQVPDARFDTVVCHQVLEHVRHPGRALEEIRRVLRPQGVLIMSVPHLSRRHELPHDYHRFTQEGVALLLGDHGFEPLVIQGYGGILSFLHHQLSFFFPGLLLPIPILGVIASAANYPLSALAVWVDKHVDAKGLLATGVIAVARPAAPAAT